MSQRSFRPTVLINGTTGAQKKPFEVKKTTGVFVTGLAGTETAKLEVLKTDEDPYAAADSQWAAVKEAGSDVEWSASDTVRTLIAPGIYRLNIAAAAGAIHAGLYEAR